jgi:PAS domain S-box-containing protein
MRRLIEPFNRGRRDEQRASRLLDIATDLLGTISADGNFGELNDAWERELGYSRPVLRSHRFLRLAHPDDRHRLSDFLALGFEGEEVGEFEARFLARDGGIVWVRWRLELATETAAGQSVLYVRGSVVTARRRMERERERLIGELSSQARSDPLTGIPNRRWLRDELAREVSRGHRQGTPFCVAMVELDGALDIDDDLIVEAVDGWRDGLRAVDFLARHEGGRFAVVLPDCEMTDATVVAERIKERVPGGRTCSVGIAEWELGLAGDDVVSRAIDALEVAHAGGGDRIVNGA